MFTNSPKALGFVIGNPAQNPLRSIMGKMATKGTMHNLRTFNTVQFKVNSKHLTYLMRIGCNSKTESFSFFFCIVTNKQVNKEAPPQVKKKKRKLQLHSFFKLR